MIIELFLMFNVLAFGLLATGLSVGLFRGWLPNGKGVAVILFMISILCFAVLAYESLNIELVGCSTVCSTDVKSYIYLSWFYSFFIFLDVILGIVYAIASFGDVLAIARQDH